MSPTRGRRAVQLWRQKLGDQCGQAMVEYSTITFAFLIGAGAAAFAAPIPGFGGETVVQAIYAALQTYVDSIFYCLSLGVT